MRNIPRSALIVLLSACAPFHAQVSEKPASYPTMAPVGTYLMASAAAEIAMARSAAPSSISARAEVLVLGKDGYEVAVKGDNGWACLVERSWTSGFDDPEFWNPHERGPSCFNPPAVASVLSQYLARTKWASAGDTRTQIEKKARPWYPHVMPFVARDKVATWAAGLPGSPIVAGPYLRSYEPAVIFIPVRRWSDGSPGPPIART